MVYILRPCLENVKITINQSTLRTIGGALGNTRVIGEAGSNLGEGTRGGLEREIRWGNWKGQSVFSRRVCSRDVIAWAGGMEQRAHEEGSGFGAGRQLGK